MYIYTGRISDGSWAGFIGLSKGLQPPQHIGSPPPSPKQPWTNITLCSQGHLFIIINIIILSTVRYQGRFDSGMYYNHIMIVIIHVRNVCKETLINGYISDGDISGYSFQLSTISEIRPQLKSNKPCNVQQIRGFGVC